MDFETQELPQESGETPFPSEQQDAAPASEKPKKRRRLPVAIGIAALLLVLAAAAVWVLRGVRVRVERTANSFSFVVEAAKQDAAEETSAEPVGPAPYLGTGKTMTVSPSAPGAPNRPSASAGALSLQEIYEAVKPCVATIRAERLRGSALGVGVVLSEDGYLVTDSRIVDRALELLVTLDGGEPQQAVLVGSDSACDVAVLKIEASGLTPAVFGDSDTLRVGDLAVAVEAPSVAGLSFAFSDGVIAGVDRDVTVNGRQTTLLRTSAPSFAGAGGPILNCYGQVVALRISAGSRSYGTSSDGVGYAIPVSAVKPVVDELLEQGYVTDRPSIGVSVEELPERVRIYYGLPGGVYVTAVQPGSGAEKAGIRTGDILTALGNQPITGSSALEQLRNNYAAGDVIELTVYRGGEYLRLSVCLTQQDAGE